MGVFADRDHSSAKPLAMNVAPAQPTMSIVVTNYNYGHFLNLCLASIDAQTQPADQVIVVDDGSTDASLDRLSKSTGFDLISQKNGGQAAAFNSGFEAATGEIVLFLDADDLLKPHAVETIKRLWTPGFSALSFDLDLVDAAGRESGHYPMDVPDRDLKETLLNELMIPFMPTSGNAFCREAIAWAFPLPTARWRICTDALLIRAAIYRAPVRHIKQTLGQYRVHGHNNYFRTGGETVAELQTGLRDASRAGLDLIALCDRSKTSLASVDRSKLLTASIRTRLACDALQHDQAGLSEFLSRALRLYAPVSSFRFFVCLAILRLALPRSRTLRGWIRDRARRPALVQSLFTLLIGEKRAGQLYQRVLHFPLVARFHLAWNLGWVWRGGNGSETRKMAASICAIRVGHFF